MKIGGNISLLLIAIRLKALVSVTVSRLPYAFYGVSKDP